MRKHFYSIVVTVFSAISMTAQHTLTVQANKPGAKVQSTMWGVFFDFAIKKFIFLS